MNRAVVLLASVAAITLVPVGVALAATIRCTGGECQGTNMPDTLYGTPANDIIFGNGDRDHLYGGGGRDSLKGGPGNDTQHGAVGDDRVKGGPGNDRLFGGEGNDIMRGGLHNRTNDGVPDTINCGPGRDTAYFTPGIDTTNDCEIRNPPTP